MVQRQTQQKFKGLGFKKPGDAFGGSLLKGNPKGKRPLVTKLPIHLTLRSLKSNLRLPKTFKSVNLIVQTTARKYGIRIYEWANVGNHLHLLIKVTKMQLWAAFIRELTGRIAQSVMELTQAGNDSKLEKNKFWRYRPHTRIIRSWQKAYQDVKDYICLNQLEALGHISRKETKSLKELRFIFDG